jgi:hypothetical protein
MLDARCRISVRKMPQSAPGTSLIFRIFIADSLYDIEQRVSSDAG